MLVIGHDRSKHFNLFQKRRLIFFHFHGKIRWNKVAGWVYDDRLNAGDQTVKKF